MKTLLVAGMLALSLGSPLAAKSTDELMMRPSSEIRRLPYRAWKPEGYETRKDWPLIVFLHGMGERGWNLEGVSKHGLPKWLDAGHKLAAVVLAPQCPPTRFWEPEDVNAMLDEAAAKYQVDPERIILTGFSMGAYGSFDFGSRFGWRLAAIVPVAGGLGSHYFQGMHDTPVWIICGGKDTAVPAEQSRDSLKRMRAVGMAPKFTEFPDADHIGTARLAYEETPELYTWMLAQKRSALGLRRHEAESIGFEDAENILLGPGLTKEVDFVVRNLSPQKRSYKFSWATQNALWRLRPLRAKHSLPPGGELRLKCSVGLMKSNVSMEDFLPLPVLRTEIDKGLQVETQLQAGLENSATVLKANKGKTAFLPETQRFYDVSDWSADKAPRTDLLASWDDTGLILKVLCLGEEGFKAPASRFKGRDEDLWMDDSVEFFIQPDRGKPEYAQCIVNRAGAFYDAWVYDRSWDSKGKASASKVEGGWVAEIHIPFARLNLKPQAGKKLGLEIVRNWKTAPKPVSMQWAPTFGGSHAPERYGVLELVD
ncbi:MAG: sugar-binding protein [candidate division FCPU426 bacterium]